MVSGILSGSKSIPPLSRKQAPLSSSQRAIWLFEKWLPGTAVFNRPANLRLLGNLNVEVLQLAFNCLIQRHEVLSARFQEIDGQPTQFVIAPQPIKLETLDLRPWPDVDRVLETERFVNNEALRPFDLVNGPLFRGRLLRLGDQERLLMLTFHHIVFDAWSMNVLLNELRESYVAFAAGNPPNPPTLPIQYFDFAQWQQEQLKGGAFEASLDYWRQRLCNLPATVDITRDYPIGQSPTFSAASHPLELSKELTDRLRHLSRQSGATLFMTLLAALQVLLYRYSGHDDLAIGMSIAGRTRVQTKHLIGCFINTLVFRSQVSPDITFNELLRRTRTTAFGTYRHQHLPFEELVKQLQPDRSATPTPFFQVMFNYRNRPPEATQINGLRIEPLLPLPAAAVDDLTVDISETQEGLRCLLRYKTDVFEQETIARFGRHLQMLLEGIVRHPDERISRIPILPPKERETIIVDWNDTRRELDASHCIHHLFEAQVLRTPNAAAVSFGEETITYDHLNRRANQLAHQLLELGARPETPMAVFMDPSLHRMIGVLGLIKAGGVYASIDPAYPRSRVQFLLQDLNPHVLLTESEFLDRLPETSAKIICLDKLSHSAGIDDGNVDVRIDEQNAAYVIYTSGSTGNPKGVVVSHRGVSNLALAERELHPCSEGDRVLQITPPSFDLSLSEIFMCLISGACLVVPWQNPNRDGGSIAGLIKEEKITVVSFTPAVLQLVLNEDVFLSCGSLRLVISGGETLSPELEQQFFARTRAALFNGYGPTEASIYTTQFQCLAAHDFGRVPIGRPLANVQTYILDSNYQPVPIGVAGELFVAGDGLARCYLNQPDLTAAQFLPNPFCRDCGGRMYKTGDRARYRSDGEIDFLGRLDKQIKIRGIRVEPGEIETALLRHPAVRDVVVTTRPNLVGGQVLVAYFRSERNDALTAQELREFLQSWLPEALVPSVFVPITSFKLSSNGKIDRGALPAPDFATETPFVAPRNDNERNLQDIWRELFDRENISINDHFFDLGGHSLLGTKFANMVQDRLGVRLPLRVLFDAPTIAQLAQRLWPDAEALPAPVYPPALVPIQPNGKQEPIFFLMASGEEASLLSYSKLFRQVGRDQPTIGILPPRRSSDGKPLDVHQMAAECVRQIRTYKPDGSYRLVGYCAGGVVIFEIAQQLQSLGQDAQLFLIDTVFPIEVPAHLGRLNRRFVSHYLGRIVHHLKALKTVRLSEKFGYLRGRARAIGELVGEPVSDEDIYLKAIGHYRPAAYHQLLTLLVTEDVYQVDPSTGWREFAKAGIEVIKIKGDHHTCMRNYAHLTAKQLRRCLDHNP